MNNSDVQVSLPKGLKRARPPVIQVLRQCNGLEAQVAMLCLIYKKVCVSGNIMNPLSNCKQAFTLSEFEG